ncbi:MAG TPA: hypothetical protein VF250_07485 [Conexibacter sp.]
MAAALVAALALGVASCGGTETTTLEGAALVRRIELACREGQRTAQREAQRTRQPRTGINITPILAAHRVMAEKVGELDTDGPDKADFERLKAAMQERLELVQQVADADRAEQSRVIRSVQVRAARTTRVIEAAARRLGVEGCS